MLRTVQDILDNADVLAARFENYKPKPEDERSHDWLAANSWWPGEMPGCEISMLIAVLLFSETTIAKLAGHGITPEEVRQVNDGDRVLIRNPRPRVEGSLLMIGTAYGGRVLTVVLEPEPADSGIWNVRTGWPASAAQKGLYRRERRHGA